jgi:hypothetical protein
MAYRSGSSPDRARISTLLILREEITMANTNNTISVPFEIVDPHGLYLRERIATGEIEGYNLEFDGAGNVFLIHLEKDGTVIKATVSVQALIENLAKALIRLQ